MARTHVYLQCLPLAHKLSVSGLLAAGGLICHGTSSVVADEPLDYAHTILQKCSRTHGQTMPCAPTIAPHRGRATPRHAALHCAAPHACTCLFTCRYACRFAFPICMSLCMPNKLACMHVFEYAVTQASAYVHGVISLSHGSYTCSYTCTHMSMRHVYTHACA